MIAPWDTHQFLKILLLGLCLTFTSCALELIGGTPQSGQIDDNDDSAQIEAITLLQYPMPVSVFATGATVFDNTPTVTGGTADVFSISPDLPAGMTFNTVTGTISGVAPGTPVAAQLYTIEASNESSTVSAQVSIEILDGFVVTAFNDPVFPPADGNCGSCSIREAISEANANAGTRQVIMIPPGNYRVTSNMTVATDDVVLMGAGPDKTNIRSGTFGSFALLRASGDSVDFEAYQMTLMDGLIGITLSAGADGIFKSIHFLRFASNGFFADVTAGASNHRVEKCHFEHNLHGASIISLGTSNIVSNTFQNNFASAADGAGLYKTNATLNLISNSFVANVASNSGGALYAGSGSNTIVNNTFTANSAASGGAIYVADAASAYTIGSNTFASNVAGAAAGPDLAGVAATVNMGSNLFMDTVDPCAVGPTYTSLGYNLSANDTAATTCNLLDVTDLSADSQSYGRAILNSGRVIVPTIEIPATSDAIDNGDDGNCMIRDTHGHTRVDLNPGGGICDIGSFEKQSNSDAAPTRLTYRRSWLTLLQNSPMTMGEISPVVQGGTPSIYTVDPALPTGLSLNPNTGVISGTPTEQVLYPRTHTFTARNSYGASVTQISMRVLPGWLVNDTTDAADANPGDGFCNRFAVANSDNCTLRAALAEANADTRNNTIAISSGTYDLSSRLTPTDFVAIVGAGADTTVIDGLSTVGILFLNTTGAEISDIQLLNGTSSVGGAVEINDVPFKASHTHFIKCSSTGVGVNDGGGAIYRYLGSINAGPQIEYSMFSLNDAASRGGAILRRGGYDSWVRNSRFESNTSATYGAAAHNVHRIEGSYFWGNGGPSVVSMAGASTGWLIGNTFWSNSATLGTLQADNGTTFHTFGNTFSTSAQYAIYTTTSGNNRFRLANNIFFNSTSGDCRLQGTSTIASLGGNISNGAASNCGFSGDDKTLTDPIFLTGIPDFDGGGLVPIISLSSNSPAIDYGLSGYCLATDSSDNSRPIDGGDGTGGAPDGLSHCDSGAYEYQP